VTEPVVAASLATMPHDSRAPQPQAGLFRPEALAEQGASLHGTTACTLGPGPRLLTALAFLTALAIIAFACWGRYTRSEHVSGTLEPSRGLVKIRTPQAGVVTERRVREGQSVRRGDVLLVLSSERVGLHAREAQADVLSQLEQRSQGLLRERDAQNQIDALAIQTLQARQRGLQADIDNVQTELRLQRRRVELSQANAARHQDLMASQFETAAAMQPHLDAELDQRSRLVQARAHAVRARAGPQEHRDRSQCCPPAQGEQPVDPGPPARRAGTAAHRGRAAPQRHRHRTG
jgi:membrane fusion protein